MSTHEKRRRAGWYGSLSLNCVVACVVVATLHWFGPLAGDQHLFSQTASAQDASNFRPRQIVKRFAPITEFPTVATRDVGRRLNPSELVLGVTVGKESRAYPINMLSGPTREILNDTLGDRAIAATW